MAVEQKVIMLDETGQQIASNIAIHTTKIEELINKHNKVLQQKSYNANYKYHSNVLYAFFSSHQD